MTAVPPPSDDENGGLSSRLRARRNALGLTLKEVGAQANVSVPFLSQLERGVYQPSLPMLFRVAAVLGTTPESLLGSPPSDEILVRRADEGEVYDVGDAGGATRRVLTGDGERYTLSIYDVPVGADLGGYYASNGRDALYVTTGSLLVRLATESGIQEHRLDTGDSIVYPTEIEHQWAHVGRRRTSFMHVQLAR
jgi:transcriptional regulator with XRE-family HTH domain